MARRSSISRVFLREAGRHPLLTASQEVALAKLVERGDPDVDSGVIGDVSKRDPILRVRLAADLPVSERPSFQVLRTESQSFADSVEARRHPTAPFYFRKPPPVLDMTPCTSGRFFR